MAWEDFLNHRCDIYHLRSEEKTPGYGLPEAERFSYPEEPDIADLECHFGVKSASINTEQEEPANMLNARVKLALPIGTDVRINDLIVNCETGYQYTAEQPITIAKQHHMFVYIKRAERQTEL